MSFEAVPCMFRSVQGPEETEYLGLLIRPAPGTQSNGNPPPQPLRVQGVYKSGAPITVSGEHAPKLLVPANVQVRVSSSSGEPTLSSGPMTIASWSGSPNIRVVPSSSGGPSVSSPISAQNRSTSVCSSSPIAESSSPMSPAPTLCSMSSTTGQFKNQSEARANGRLSRQWPGSNVSDSSTTPDSGIQSIPNSPPGAQTLSPPNIEACTSLCEELADEEDYADMPHLVPADEDEECAPGPSGLRDDCLLTNDPECDSSIPPAISITPTMDSTEIVEQLLQLDPKKANAIARLIRLKTQEQKRKSSDGGRESATPRRSRPQSAASDDMKKMEDEPKRDTSKSSRKRSLSSEPIDETIYTKFSPEDLKKRYREAVKKRLNDQLYALLEKARSAVEDLRIGERERHDRRGHKESKIFFVDWESVRKRQKKEDEKKKKTDRKRPSSASGRQKKDSESFVKEKRRKTISSNSELSPPSKENKTSKLPTRTASKRRSEDVPSFFEDHAFDKKKESDGEDVKRSFCYSNLCWSSPIVHCGCSRGACTSDAECVNRALCVQCPQNCHTSLCVNKKFWREDVVRHLISTGNRGKRILKTRQSKRAGEFMGEYAGEVITFEEAIKRVETYKDENCQPCILAISSILYIDATKKGNITRYVRHSCRPNSRIEVWSINGKRRAGLFSLFDIASGSEITVDMNRLLPVEIPCINCPVPSCSGVVMRSRNSVLAASDDVSFLDEQQIRAGNVFLIRNRTKTIELAKRRFVATAPIVPPTLDGKLKRVVDGLALRIRRIDGSLPFKALKEYGLLKQFVKDVESGKEKDDVSDTFSYLIDRWLERLNDDDFDRVFQALHQHYLPSATNSDSKTEKKTVARTRNREVNLSYLDVGDPVGSYDPDISWPQDTAKEGDDAVRCECGSLEEDGHMMQCDECHYWLHSECLDGIDQNGDFTCKFCSGAIRKDIPSCDVILAKQPEIRLAGCEYYKALNNNRKIQVRLNETVYVERAAGDEHKKLLKLLVENGGKSNRKKDGLSEEYKSIAPPSTESLPPKLFDRKDLRAFRVERIFVAPTGHRFVFGFYYARPHETICDPNRIFNKNEVFATRFYDTLPLDAVVGRCLVLDADIWCKGRPKYPTFREEDIFVCEYQIDRQQRSFEKIPPRNRFPINTQSYAFNEYPEHKQVIRDFTPFIINERGSSSANGRISRTDSSKAEQFLKKQAEQRVNTIALKLSNNLLSKSEKRRKK